MSTNPTDRIVRAIQGAVAPAPEPQDRLDALGQLPPDEFTDGFDDGDAPSDLGLDKVDGDLVKACAGLDHSDTDNGERLRRHFGQDLAVMAQEGTAGGDWLCWTGSHWDLAAGAARARLIVQKLGGRIGLEASYLQLTPEEAKAVRKGKKAAAKDEGERSAEDRKAIEAKTAAERMLDQRKGRRRAFAVTSKNKARMEAALECAAPHLRRPPDLFNPGRVKFATQTHTIHLSRVVDDECEDDSITRFRATLHVEAGHRREDWITSVVPTAYDPDAQAPRWRAFMEEMLPDAEKRRTVQQFAGLGLLAVPVQNVMFHYGLGANGKSVFLETVCRLLGPGLAVGLPRESIVGGSERAAGGASPDIVRLYTKRLVRITELKADVPLQEDLIKRLTGGEPMPVRTLFKGYFEFQNFATPHMSGNGFPTIDGTDHGIWRRLLIVHWDQTMPPERQRDFEEFVSEFVVEEGPGVLNWLIEGALDFYAHGLYVAPAVRASTDEYREEMDPIGEFLNTCVRKADGLRVQANDMYQAYVSWSLANAKRSRTQTKFGKELGKRYQKSEIEGRNWYQDVELHSVPLRPIEPRNPENYGS